MQGQRVDRWLPSPASFSSFRATNFHRPFRVAFSSSPPRNSRSHSWVRAVLLAPWRAAVSSFPPSLPWKRGSCSWLQRDWGGPYYAASSLHLKKKPCALNCQVPLRAFPAFRDHHERRDCLRPAWSEVPQASLVAEQATDSLAQRKQGQPSDCSIRSRRRPNPAWSQPRTARSFDVSRSLMTTFVSQQRLAGTEKGNLDDGNLSVQRKTFITSWRQPYHVASFSRNCRKPKVGQFGMARCASPSSTDLMKHESPSVDSSDILNSHARLMQASSISNRLR